MPESLTLTTDETALIEKKSSETIFNYFLQQCYLDEEKQIINVVLLFIKLFAFFNKVALSESAYSALSRRERSQFTEQVQQLIAAKIESMAKRVQDEVLFETSYASVRRLVKKEGACFWQVIYCLAIYKQCNLADSELKMEVIDWFIRTRLPQPSTFAGWAPFKSACLPYKTYGRLLTFHDTQRQQFKSNLFTRAYAAFIEGLYIASLQQLKQMSHQLIEQRHEQLSRETQMRQGLETVMLTISTILYDNLDKTTANMINAEIFTRFKVLRQELEMQSGVSDLSVVENLKNYVTDLVDSMSSLDTVRHAYQLKAEMEGSEDVVGRLLVG